MAFALEGLGELVDAAAACAAGLELAPADAGLLARRAAVAQRAATSEIEAGVFCFCGESTRNPPFACDAWVYFDALPVIVAPGSPNTTDPRRCVAGGVADMDLLGRLQSCGKGGLHVAHAQCAGDLGESPPFTNDFVSVALEPHAWELLIGAVASEDPRCRWVAAKSMEHAVMHEV